MLAFLPLQYLHHLDHIVPIASELECKLLITDPLLLKKTREFYPEIHLQFTSLSELSPERVLEFQFIISTFAKSYILDFFPVATHTLNWNPYSIWVPHGHSDKVTLSGAMADLERTDAALVYGKAMEEQILSAKVPTPLTLHTVGNYRKVFFKKHAEFYKNITDHRFAKALASGKKIVLYAPSWEFSMADLAKEVWNKDEFFIIFKPHPITKHKNYFAFLAARELCETSDSFLFEDSFTPIYPLLSICDGVISDHSSVTYDTWAAGVPLVLLSKPTPRHFPIDSYAFHTDNFSTALDYIGSTPRQTPDVTTIFDPNASLESLSVVKQFYN